jgi:hypothetical protein
MKHIVLLFISLSFGLCAYSQSSGDFPILKDTIRVPKENKVYESQYVITTLKNGSTIQIIKSSNNKFYMRIVTSENLYFDKKDVLEIQSGSKSFFAKETTNYPLNKNTGFYTVEIFKNYVGTLKDDGITGLVFGEAKTTYSKQDCNQIKQMAKFFYESFCIQKK